MPIYKYTALSESGSLVTGEVVSATNLDVENDLAAKGLLVKTVIEKKPFIRIRNKGNHVKAEVFLLFCSEFLALIRAGLSITESLAITSERPEHPFFQRTLKNVLNDIKRGVEFSAVCKKHPDVFDNLFISAISTGERTGDMVTVIERYNQQLRKNIAVSTKFKQALSYPIFLFAVMVAIIAVLFTFVMPRFITMYSDFDTELPIATQLLLSFVENLYVIAPFLAVGVVIVAVAFKYMLSTDKGKYNFDLFKIKFPYIGALVEKKAIGYIARILSALLSSGMPLIDSLQATKYAVNNRVFKYRLNQAITLVTEGNSLSKSMTAMSIFPATAGKMIEAGEASGNLETMLDDIANFYDEKLEFHMTRIVSLIEPVFMLIMGIIIGGIIIVMYLPIFNIASAIK